MRAPLSWLREFAAIPESISAEAISDAFIRVGFEVEEIITQGADLTGPLVVAKVLAIEELTGNKKPIRYVELDCGEKQSRFVICGATNFAVGDLVVAALPGAILPGNFAISARETYGKTSNGMICSSRELGLGEDHSGIIVLPANSLDVGTDAIAALEINDVIFDIAVNPDRGYALSIRGLAREIAGALNLNFVDPVDALKKLEFKKSGTGVTPVLEDGASVFYLRTLANYKADALTPLWMSRRIEKMGMRSISLAVDITNYVMLELGQPLHAFDRSKIKGNLRIGRVKKEQKFTTLDGQERSISPQDLMVMDDNGPLALAGTMGGLESEITNSTTELALEAVRFDPIAIAKNSRRHKLSTEASRRLERHVDSSLAEFASARFAQLLIDLGGASHVDTQHAGEPRFAPIVKLDPAYVSQILGFSISPEKIREILTVIGCDVDKEFNVDPPSWRWDLTQPADFVEEVARMIGYDAIPSLLPPRPKHASLTWSQKRIRVISSALAARGLSEVQTFPFTSDSIIESMGYVNERAKTYRIANPMSEDFPVLRTHLLPGLAAVASRNIGRGAKDFAIFEVGSIFRNSKDLVTAISPELDKKPSKAKIEEIFGSVPVQHLHLGAILVGKIEDVSWRGSSRSYEWSDAIAMAQEVLQLCNLEFTIVRSDFAPWHPGRCAELQIDGKPVAHAGELHPRVVEQFSLPARSVAFVINLTALPQSPLVRGEGVGAMPPALQDVALIVDEKVSAASVESALRKGAGELLESIVLFDRYDKMGDGKVSLAYSLTFRAPDRTLTGAEITQARESAVAQAVKDCGAVLRTA
jgi:phenylalanyl-tRNA synthetase beta chain